MTAELDLCSSSQSSAYGLGPFTIHPNSQSLYKDGQEVTVEPKVFEVLLYLCQNHERYIQTHELHESVWKGRVVSDAAVRRSISKLRHLLDNDDKQYIKSVHKRGYKLDCFVQYLEDDSPPTTNEHHENKQHYVTTGYQQNRAFVVSKWLKPGAIIFVICITGLFFWLFFKTSPIPAASDSQVKLLNFPGKKSHAVLNKDGSILVFAGKVIGSQGFQLFVSNLKNDEVRQLTSKENNVIGVSISADQKFVLFIDMTLGNSSVKRLPINGSVETPEILLQDHYLISDLAIDPNNKGFYFSGLKTKNSSSKIYYFDYVGKNITNITSGYRSDVHDYKVAVSKNGNLLAVSTVSGGGKEHKITVYNSQNRNVVKRLLHNSPIFYLSWMNNDRLLVLDEKNIFELALSTGIKHNIVKNEQGKIISIAAIDENKILILKESPSEDLFMEVSIPTFDIASQRMMTKSQGLIREALYFVDDDSILFNEIQENKNIARVKGMSGSSEQILLKTVTKMNLIDVSPNGTYVLLKLAGILALLNKDSSEIKYINGGSKFISIDATFSNDSKYVYFGEKTQDGWVINRFNVSTSEKSVLFRGYKSIRQFDGGYFMINENDKLYRFDTSKNKALALNIDVTIDKNTRWFVRQGYVYWSQFDGKSSFFHIFNMATNEIASVRFGASKIDTRFDVNKDGTKALLRNSQLSETNIIELQLP
jgi:DNA-binding winged helix-turn-helix (wHTH) protein